MRIFILTAVLAVATATAPAAAALSEDRGSCVEGQQPIRHFSNWSTNSEAICDYGFVEANRRIADLIEASSGEAGVEWLQKALGVPKFTRRDEWEPNSFYVVKAAHQVALVGRDNWEMIVATYQHRREGDWGRKDDFTVDFLGTGVAPTMEAAFKGRCLSEAEVLDRALAAGWHYVPGRIESGTAGPIFWPGSLSKVDGRSLSLAHLSRTTELPPRETLEATCAWIVKFEERRETRSAKPG
ncbi:hypothetical protein [Sphingopyxis sp.]|jgi:hypothetical protein|uniref:hypothetical protein n=1 Tax=Sphingopyxis sp. TaxID=1908224 RepID=UPI003F72FEFD